MVKKLLAQFNKILRWFSRIKKWLNEWHFFACGFALPVSLILTCYLMDWGENSISLIGLLLQLLAIGTVFYEIDKTLKKFDEEKRGVWATWKDRLKRFPPFTLETILGNGNLVTGRSSLTAILKQSYGDKSDILEERVEILEKQFSALHNQLAASDLENNKKIKAIHEMIHQEERNRNDLDNEINLTIKEVSTGGLPIAGMGLFWLFCGIIMSSIPEEIETILNAIHQF